MGQKRVTKSLLAMTYFPQGLMRSVSSALRRFTSVFGMGTGGSTSLQSPGGLRTNLALFSFVKVKESKSVKVLSLLISTLNQVKPSTISTAKLNPLLDVHMPPIKQVVYLRPYSPCGDGKPHLGAGFTLRCFQRLSEPNLATQRCPWRDNWYTIGLSFSILSY